MAAPAGKSARTASLVTIRQLRAARTFPSCHVDPESLVPAPSKPFPDPIGAACAGDGWGTSETTRACGPALAFRADGSCKRARATTLRLPHGDVATPIFMPVGTHGTVKGLASEELADELGCNIALANTYHLGVRPGGAVLEALGGLHEMMRWPRNLLTDSGGFQMVSLLHLATITEQGVTFQSPTDGTTMLLTPEASIALQNQIGSDIMMALDDVVDSKTVDDARFREACDRTLRWLDRCVAANKRPDQQSLFGIVQGGLDTSPGGLREQCLVGMLERDEHLPGYAIGGLAGGEDKGSFWRVVARCCEALPADKPRYLMGVGYPLDLVVCVSLGVDMFDCVFPTRTARFGNALVRGGQLRLKHRGFARDPRPVDEACGCKVCKSYTRAQLHALLREPESLGPQLLTHHNIAYMLGLCHDMREAVMGGEWQAFVRRFLLEYFAPAGREWQGAGGGGGVPTPGERQTEEEHRDGVDDYDARRVKGTQKAVPPIPRWVAEALAYSGVDIGDRLRSLVQTDPDEKDPDTAALPAIVPDWKDDKEGGQRATASSSSAVAHGGEGETDPKRPKADRAH